MSEPWATKKELEGALRQIHTRLDSLLANGLPQPLDVTDGPTFDHLHLTNLLYVGTGGIKEFRYSGTLADDATYTLPFSQTLAIFGFVQCKNANWAGFYVDSTGAAYNINGTNYALNADTDGKICIGTAASQVPTIFKNRAGSSRTLVLILWYL